VETPGQAAGYRSLAEFEADLLCLLDNARAWEQPGTLCYTDAQKLQEVSEAARLSPRPAPTETAHTQHKHPHPHPHKHARTRSTDKAAQRPVPGIDYQSGNLGLTIDHHAACCCVQVAREVLGRELCEDPEENYARLLAQQQQAKGGAGSGAASALAASAVLSEEGRRAQEEVDSRSSLRLLEVAARRNLASARQVDHPPSIFLDKNSCDIGESQPKWNRGRCSASATRTRGAAAATRASSRRRLGSIWRREARACVPE
jgi:hypothetical protein